MSSPVWVCVLRTCLALIGVVGREESLQHTDPPVSCPCAQPVMSKASSSRAPCLSLWALSIPSTSLPRAVVSPQGASRPSPQRPVLLRVQPSPPCFPQPGLWVCASQPCSECPLPKDQTQLFWGCPMALQVPYLHGLPSFVHSKLCHARVFCWGTCMLTVRWSLREREKSIGLEGLNLKVVKLLCKLQSVIQWKLLLL